MKMPELFENKNLKFIVSVIEKNASEERIELSRVFSLLNEAVALFDREKKLLFFTEAFARIYGYDTPENLLGSSWKNFYMEKEIRLFERIIFPELIKRKLWKGVSEGKKKDGSVFQQDVLLILLSNGCTIFRIKDITEKNKILQEREEAYIIDTRKNFDLFINTLVKVVELRDPYTSGHQQRVSQLSTSIAKKMNLSFRRIEAIKVAALLHDIGKIYIPSEILNNPSRLTKIEFEMIKQHSQNGYELLKDIQFDLPVAEFVLQHHERNDGSGYPKGLTENEIYLESQILAVADVVEAISSHRPYRASLGIEAAFDEIKGKAGSAYNAEVVQSCLELFEEGFEFNC
jgi:putative nucleotidyltransferase with HDIG domain/PAS domain S-box-containing protein